LDLGLGDLSNEIFRVESESDAEVVFVLERGGLEIRKTYQFDLEGYGFDLIVEVRNESGHLVSPDFTLAWPAIVREGNDYKEESLVVLHAEDLERELVSSVGGTGFLGFGASGAGEVWRGVSWAGVDLKYFASLVLPEQIDGTRATFQSLDQGESAVTMLAYPASEIAPGQALERRWQAYLGPKQPEILEAIGHDLPKSVDLGYSWFEPLTQFFQWLLKAAYSVIPNYGWSIVLITIVVRVAMFPIMNRQMRSMEKMRALQPRLKELQAKYADDRQKQSEATMAMYKETGVNPLGGCLPMLLQFPVFIGLFFALQSSFDLRQAEFILWIDDLSAPDQLFMIPGLDFPFRLLPIIMGGSMILQQKLTPTTVDPSQQMMMLVMMPVMMTVLFYQFPSGLVLYWMVSNFLGIAHQKFIGRRMKAAEAAT
jgi:YidC/Oxa1 family membrane protein insertase